ASGRRRADLRLLVHPSALRFRRLGRGPADAVEHPDLPGRLHQPADRPGGAGGARDARHHRGGDGEGAGRADGDHL
ncbi:hypothetical protein LTR94_037576, partial [Friedmanniomyces endolithicus]